jgi:leucine efflux protein
MFGIIDLPSYILGVIVIVLAPGPNSVYVFALAAQHGARAAYLGILGVVVGDTILMALATIGAASLFKANPSVFVLIKYIGATYLAWIGVRLLYGAWYKWRQHRTHLAQTAAPPALSNIQLDGKRPFTKGLIIDLLNPEAILFFLSFFIQFINPAYPNPALSLAMLGIIFQITSVAYLSLLIFAGMWLANLFRQRRWLTASAESSAGALFIGFGLKLITENGL